MEIVGLPEPTGMSEKEEQQRLNDDINKAPIKKTLRKAA